jgi:hypothetical protein
MDQSIFYNRQNVTQEDFAQIYLDVEKVIRDHIKDWHSAVSAFVLDSHKYEVFDENGNREKASDLRVFQPLASGDITISVNPGVAFASTERIELQEQVNYTVINIPSEGTPSNFVRIDLLYITKIKNSVNFRSREFIDVNKNVYQQTINTRQLDGYELQVITGQVAPIITKETASSYYPVIPAELQGKIVPLAYIWLKPNTMQIMNIFSDATGIGYIEDARVLVTPSGI